MYFSNKMTTHVRSFIYDVIIIRWISSYNYGLFWILDMMWYPLEKTNINKSDSRPLNTNFNWGYSRGPN